MLKITGKPVFGGITRGKITCISHTKKNIPKSIAKDVKIEMKRYEEAKKAALKELTELYNTAIGIVGENEASIFLIHKMIIEDNEMDKTIIKRICVDHFNADYSVELTKKHISDVLLKSDSEYMRERAADICDVCSRLVRLIQNKSERKISPSEKRILFTDDLLPSEVIQLDRSNVLAIITCQSSPNSHMAILAKCMNIPTIVDTGAQKLRSLSSKNAAVDAFNGTVYIEPDKEILKEIEITETEEAKKRELLNRFKDRKSITLDGTEIPLYANISGLNDIDKVLDNYVSGIGLFKSEFLFLDHTDIPDEDTQFYNYRQILERMKGKQVIISTIDTDTDKHIQHFGLKKEKNPALGIRSIRLCLTHPEIFKVQLRALLRASVYGNLSILLPMITDIEEIKRTKQLINDAKEELKQKSQPFNDNVPIGIMIETPAAVILSDELAKEADFFNIGTKDLEQYIMAYDNNNIAIGNYFQNNSHHALIEFMKIACINARKNGIKTWICGRYSSDLSLIEDFLKIGVDYISVNPSQILHVKQKIRSIRLDKEFSRVHKPEQYPEDFNE